MNFDFEKFRKTCNDIHFNSNVGMLDLRNKHDQRAFTDYMLNNNIEHTPFGRLDPLPEFFDVDDILDFLEV